MLIMNGVLLVIGNADLRNATYEAFDSFGIVIEIDLVAWSIVRRRSLDGIPATPVNVLGLDVREMLVSPEDHAGSCEHLGRGSPSTFTG